MKKNRRIIATLLFMVLIGAVLWIAAKGCYNLEREACFGRLKGYTVQTGNEIRGTFERDGAYLQRLAKLFAGFDLDAPEGLKEAEASLASMGDTGMISRLELLLPHERMVTGNGMVEDVSGRLSFAEEAEKGVHISSRRADPLNQDVLILRHCVPVMKDGQVTAILSGVIDLDRLQQLFSVDGYGDDLQLYVVERETGNFILDTWHEKLGNIADFEMRKTKPGYDWEQFLSDTVHGKEGTVVFLSQNAGEYFYAYTAPVGVEDWMVMLNAPEHTVFTQAGRILRSFFELAALLLLFFAFYFAWMLWDVRQDKIRSERQLRNVRYIMDVEKELFDAHMYPEHFISALQKTADFLTAQTAFIWFADGETEAGGQIWSSSGRHAAAGEHQNLITLFSDLFPVLKEKGYLISYNVTSLGRELPSAQERLSRHGIRNLMLKPVTGLSGEIALILGACNMRQRWNNTEPLDQVSLCFSKAVNHYGAYRTLKKMGQTDGLTGLMNRNSFHMALDVLCKEKYGSLACIYIDANGLHEINNHLGHQAGDKMLTTVADVLLYTFPESGVYRIGGDEFVVICKDIAGTDVYNRAGLARQDLENRGYGISVGIEWSDSADMNIRSIVNLAEEAMRKDKRKYYRENGKERQMRAIDEQLEQMMLEKKDAENFLNVLAPEFKGVYFVDLSTDTIRHLYIPPYFEEILKETGDIFSKGLILYSRRIVRPEYREQFEKFCDYDYLESRLKDNITPEFIYQKMDGAWLRLRILKFKNYTAESRETLWIFSNCDQQEGKEKAEMLESSGRTVTESEAEK